ncbi:uncharacterized protein BNAC05G28690D isoform X1 [Brassica napus]|uniref:(rape) hypothetical protein n=1 Tax=Brassica napus TaxID=3708 RepID=A0A816L5K9_BRANA|nr:uncharacterized protein BNAC05G28690D isoform X1 [Brassica napus]CAF1930578.1 unnamed protein product [Brassica napus]
MMLLIRQNKIRLSCATCSCDSVSLSLSLDFCFFDWNRSTGCRRVEQPPSPFSSRLRCRTATVIIDRDRHPDASPGTPIRPHLHDQRHLRHDQHQRRPRDLCLPSSPSLHHASIPSETSRFELNSGGCVGWGEAPILLSVTAEDHITAMVKAREAFELLRELPEMKLGHVLQEIGGILPCHRFASVRAGVEMAMIDAAAKSVGVPLWKLFGEASNTITTNITIQF